MIQIAQEDHPYIMEWLNEASRYGGDFLRNFALSALRADPDNYPYMRPLVWMFYQKYPKHQPSTIKMHELLVLAEQWERAENWGRT